MKGKLILFLALVLGVITTYFFYEYMKDYQVASAIETNTAEVVVAKDLIKKNQQIQPEDLKVVSLPEAGLHGDVLHSTEGLQGKFATADIFQNEPILANRLRTQQEEQLHIARKIKDGYRAVSLGVNFVQSVSNLIEPGNYVDLIVTIAKKEGKETIVNSQIVKENVRVLAVGRRMIESDSHEDYVEYSSITLELHRMDAVKVIEASQKGTIHMTLHSNLIPEKD